MLEDLPGNFAAHLSASTICDGIRSAITEKNILVFYKSILSHHHSYHSEIIRISRTILISQNLFVDTQDEFPRARRRFRRARLRPLDEAKRRIQSDAVSRLHAAAADTRAHAFAGEEPANIQACSSERMQAHPARSTAPGNAKGSGVPCRCQLNPTLARYHRRDRRPRLSATIDLAAAPQSTRLVIVPETPRPLPCAVAG